jgi:hypothetical protein
MIVANRGDFNVLPEECLIQVLQFLDTKNIVHTISRVCKDLNIYSKTESIWNRLFITDYQDSKIEAKDYHKISWFLLYQTTTKILFVTQHKMVDGKCVFDNDYDTSPPFFSRPLFSLQNFYSSFCTSKPPKRFELFPSGNDVNPDLRVIPHIKQAWAQLKLLNEETKPLIPSQAKAAFDEMLEYQQEAGRVERE